MTIIRLFFIAIFLFTFLGCTSKSNPPEPLAINLEDVEWGAAGVGSIAPTGTRTALQSTNAKTGGYKTDLDNLNIRFKT